MPACRHQVELAKQAAATAAEELCFADSELTAAMAMATTLMAEETAAPEPGGRAGAGGSGVGTPGPIKTNGAPAAAAGQHIPGGAVRGGSRERSSNSGSRVDLPPYPIPPGGPPGSVSGSRVNSGAYQAGSGFVGGTGPRPGSSRQQQGGGGGDGSVGGGGDGGGGGGRGMASELPPPGPPGSRQQGGAAGGRQQGGAAQPWTFKITLPENLPAAESEADPPLA